MFKVARIGDKGDHQGCRIITGDDKHIVDDRKLARIGDLVYCPKRDKNNKPHGVNPIIAQSAEIVINGDRKTAHLVSKTKCGAKIITGSELMIIDRKPDQEDGGKD